MIISSIKQSISKLHFNIWSISGNHAQSVNSHPPTSLGTNTILQSCDEAGISSLNLFSISQLFHLFINPRRACAARVTVVVLCVCLSVKSHLIYGASVRPENAVTYSAGKEGQKICGDLPETTAFKSYAAKHERKSQYANYSDLPMSAFSA